MKLARTGLLMALLLAAAPAFAQGFGGRGGRGGGGFGGGESASGLLRMTEVQTELKLDPAQVDLVKQLQAEFDQKRRSQFQGGGGQNFRDLSPAEREKLLADFRERGAKLEAEQEQKLGEILEPKQMSRLKQLVIQRAGTQALRLKEVADGLKLDADQKSKIEAALAGERQSMQSIFMGNFNPGERPSPEQIQASQTKMAELRTATDGKLLAVLPDPQNKQFDTMKGAAFKFPERQPFGRRQRQ